MCVCVFLEYSEMFFIKSNQYHSFQCLGPDRDQGNGSIEVALLFSYSKRTDIN